MHQSYRNLVSKVARELGLPVVPEDWTGCDAVLPILEKMKDEGAVIVLKLDGQRSGEIDNGPYTAVVSAEFLEERFFRTDASSIEDALAHIIVSYAKSYWRCLE